MMKLGIEGEEIEITNLKLKRAKDGSGINVVAEVNGENFYLARFTEKGKIIVFKNNGGIGFETDDEGHIIVEFRE